MQIIKGFNCKSVMRHVCRFYYEKNAKGYPSSINLVCVGLVLSWGYWRAYSSEMRFKQDEELTYGEWGMLVLLREYYFALVYGRNCFCISAIRITHKNIELNNKHIHLKEIII